jgi:small ligand-binding sensory domain FIST
MTVTAVKDNLLLELAGVRALDKLEQVVATLSHVEQARLVQGLQIGVAMNEYADDRGPGDFLIRAVLGADRGTGAIAVGDVVEVGQTVRFQVRDATAADEELTHLLEEFGQRDPTADLAGALLFSCNGRGRALFPSADHDVDAVRRGLGTDPVAGFFAAGEIGPVGGSNHLHGLTASILAVGQGRSARSET